MIRSAFLLPLLLGACSAPALEDDPTSLAREASADLEPFESVRGVPLAHSVHDPPDAPDASRDTVLFVATIHGDEAAGTPLLRELARRLTADPALLGARRAVLVPVANPDGLAAGTRTNAVGVDLNRNFPAHNYRERARHGGEPLSEPEARFLAALIEAYRPDRIVSIHQAADRIDYDGPAGSLAYRLAAVSPFEVRRMGARPGSLGSWAGEDLGLAVVTLELPEDATGLGGSEAWRRYGALLLEALR